MGKWGVRVEGLEDINKLKHTVIGCQHADYESGSKHSISQSQET